MDKTPMSSAQGFISGEGIARVTVDNLNPIIFEAPKPGGTEHPGPLQYTLASLCACTLFMVDMIGKELGMEITEVETTADSKIDPAGMKGVANVKPYYTSVDQVIRIKTRNKEKLPELENQFKHRCPMYNLIDDTGLSHTIKYELMQ